MSERSNLAKRCTEPVRFESAPPPNTLPPNHSSATLYPERRHSCLTTLPRPNRPDQQSGRLMDCGQLDTMERRSVAAKKVCRVREHQPMVKANHATCVVCMKTVRSIQTKWPRNDSGAAFILIRFFVLALALRLDLQPRTAVLVNLRQANDE